MNKCLKCGKEIDSLLNVQSTISTYKMTLINKDYSDMYELIDTDGDDGFNNFCCPECNEVLFYNEEEAVKFLETKRSVIPKTNLPEAISALYDVQQRIHTEAEKETEIDDLFDELCNERNRLINIISKYVERSDDI